MTQAELVGAHRALHPFDTVGDRLVAPIAEELQLLSRLFPRAAPLAHSSRIDEVIMRLVSRPNVFGIPERAGQMAREVIQWWYRAESKVVRPLSKSWCGHHKEHTRHRLAFCIAHASLNYAGYNQ